MTFSNCRNSIGVLCCLPTITHLQAHVFGFSFNLSQSTIDQCAQPAQTVRDFFLGEK